MSRHEPKDPLPDSALSGGGDAYEGKVVDRREALRKLGTIGVVLASTRALAGARQEPSNACSVSTTDLSSLTDDADCGKLVAPGSSDYNQDNDCLDSLTGQVGEGRDADCGKEAAGTGVHKDSDCGKPGALYKNKDADCGESDGGTQSVHSDADCNNSSGPSSYNSDSDCTGEGNRTDGDCNSPAGVGRKNVDGDDTTVATP